jgi:hypothetical protein
MHLGAYTNSRRESKQTRLVLSAPCPGDFQYFHICISLPPREKLTLSISWRIR